MTDLVSRLIEGFLAPRASARRLLDGGHDWDVIVPLMILGYVLTATSELIFVGGTSDAPMVARHVVGLAMSAAGLAVLSFLAWKLGGISGGKATFKQMILVLSWQNVVAVVLSPFMFMLWHDLQESAAALQTEAEPGTPPPMPDISGGLLLGGTVAGLYSLWLLASYIAEAHDFRNTWGVMGVIMALPMMFVVLAVGALGGA